MDRRCAEAASGIARRHLRPALEINILKLCLSVGARRSNLDLARELYPNYDNSHFLKNSAKGGAVSFGQQVSEKDRRNDHNS